MANIRSALKRIRQNEKRRVRNAAIRSSVRGAVRTARAALAEGSADAGAAVSRTIQALDKAVTKGVVHRNAAARRIRASWGRSPAWMAAARHAAT